MILKYEKACEEACKDKDKAFNEKDAAKVRNYLDGQKKQLRKKKKTKEKNKVVFNSWEQIIEDKDKGEKTLGTDTEDVLDMIIQKMDRERLANCLAKLSEDDRKLILTVYGCDDNKVNVSRAAEILGKPRTTVAAAHRRILTNLKREFFKNN